MAMNDEPLLDSGWIATADIGSNPDPDSITHLGSFQTLIGFWRFFNNLGEQQPMDRLPTVINFRFFRNTIASKAAINERAHAAGSWDIALSSKDGSVNTHFVTLCMLSCCELLGPDINGVIFRRSLSETKVTLWTESNSDAVRNYLAKFFTADDITGIRFLSHSVGGEKLPSARNKGAAAANHPVAQYSVKEALAMKHHSACSAMPSDLHSVQWTELLKESVAHSLRLSKCPTSEYQSPPQMASPPLSPSKGDPPPGFGSKKAKILRLKPSRTQQQLEQKHKMAPRKVVEVANSKQIARIMGVIRNLYDNYYQVTFGQDLELKLRTILNAEKCPLSMMGYDADDGPAADSGHNGDGGGSGGSGGSGGDDDDGAGDNSLGFAILKCRLLNCQHVVRLSGAAAKGTLTAQTLRTFHSSEFVAAAPYPLGAAVSYTASTEREQPRRRFKICIRFHHLLSDCCSDAVAVPEHAQSVRDPLTLSEHILLFYDERLSPYKDCPDAARYHHVKATGGQPVYLRFTRGRVVGTLQDLNSQSQFTVQFTYDLSRSAAPSESEGVVLEHIDSASNSAVKVFVRREAASQKYRLVAIKYEFVVKQATPTLSPTFMASTSSSSNNNQTAAPPVAQPQVSPNIAAQISSPQHQATRSSALSLSAAAAAALRTLSPPQGPVTPQALHSVTPQQQPLSVNLMTVSTPTGPVPVTTASIISVAPTAAAAQPLPQQYSLAASPGMAPLGVPAQNTPIHHHYRIANVASLTAPSVGTAATAAAAAAASIPLPPSFPMSPGGSIGLSAAAHSQHAAPPQQQQQQQQQQLQAVNNKQSAYYSVGGGPATSTPVLQSQTASIESILSPGQRVQGVAAPHSVSNGMVQSMGGATYSPLSRSMAHSVSSAPMSYDVGVRVAGHGGQCPPSQSVSAAMSPAATHLGYSGHTPGGSLGAMASPAMTGYVGGQYLAPMSPVTHSINTTLSGLEQQHQVQPFALNNYRQHLPSYSTPLAHSLPNHHRHGQQQHHHQPPHTAPQPQTPQSQQQHNAQCTALTQPAMLQHINQGLQSGTGSLVHGAGSVMRPARGYEVQPPPQSLSTPHSQQHGHLQQQHHDGPPVAHSQRGYGGGGGQRSFVAAHSVAGQRGYGGGGGPVPVHRKRGGSNGRNGQRPQYRPKGRDKRAGRGRLHDARVGGTRIMGRGSSHYHHHSVARKQRAAPYHEQQHRERQRLRGGASSAFGFPPAATSNAEADGVPATQSLAAANGADADDAAESAGNGSVASGGGSAGVLSPKTPTMIDHVVDRVYFIAKTQSGSRFVQEKLGDAQYFGLFFKELKSHVAELMVDNFGHYAVEALFTHCSDRQRLVLVSNLCPHLAQVACHKQGSFSIQAMMDTLSTDEQIGLLVEALSRDLRAIILNHSGHYVILRFLQRYDWPHSKLVHTALTQHTLDLATDHYGLRVMKAAVDAGPIEEMSAVMASIVKHATTLVENQYGNYIIQHLLDLGPQDVTDQIKDRMHGKFVRYSKQKFSSNVVEKCLRHSTTEQLQRRQSGQLQHGQPPEKDWATVIVSELLTKCGDLISDKYGNYCLQTALQAATYSPALLQHFEKCTKPHLDTLRENVKAKWCKLLEGALEKQRKMHHIAVPPPQPAVAQVAGSNNNEQRILRQQPKGGGQSAGGHQQQKFSAQPPQMG